MLRCAESMTVKCKTQWPVALWAVVICVLRSAGAGRPLKRRGRLCEAMDV
jgi:hypothetical protein